MSLRPDRTLEENMTPTTPAATPTNELVNRLRNTVGSANFKAAQKAADALESQAEQLAAAIAERDGLREQVERMREALEFAPEPFVYGCTECGGANYGCKCESTKGLTIPLYDHYF